MRSRASRTCTSACGAPMRRRGTSTRWRSCPDVRRSWSRRRRPRRRPPHRCSRNRPRPPSATSSPSRPRRSPRLHRRLPPLRRPGGRRSSSPPQSPPSRPAGSRSSGRRGGLARKGSSCALRDPRRSGTWPRRRAAERCARASRAHPRSGFSERPRQRSRNAHPWLSRSARLVQLALGVSSRLPVRWRRRAAARLPRARPGSCSHSRFRRLRCSGQSRARSR